jgi:hypothetical protein
MSVSPSMLSNTKSKRREKSNDDNNLKILSTSRDKNASLLKNFDKLRPTTAYASKPKRSNMLIPVKA